MTDPAPKCSHCGAVDSIGETISCYYCSECGWWGTSPDRIVYEPSDDEDWREGQVPRRPSTD